MRGVGGSWPHRPTIDLSPSFTTEDDNLAFDRLALGWPDPCRGNLPAAADVKRRHVQLTARFRRWRRGFANVATDWPWLTLVPILLLAMLARLAWPARAFPSAHGQGRGGEPARLRFSLWIRGFTPVWIGKPSSECRTALPWRVWSKPSTWPRGWNPPRTACLDLTTWLRVSWPTGLFRRHRLRPVELHRACEGVETGETA